MGPEIIIPLSLFGTVVILTFGLPLIRFHIRKKELQITKDPAVLARLYEIERSLESVALEVERISEGQRFVTKLLASRKEPLLLTDGKEEDKNGTD